MSRPEPSPERYTLREFYELELNAPDDERWELIDGVICKMMTGGTSAHNEIIGNLHFALRRALAASGRPGTVYTENVRVVSERDDIAVYPDVMVRCGDRWPGQNAFEDPVFIVEVLSRATAEKDRYDKAEAYYRIPTIGSYRLV